MLQQTQVNRVLLKYPEFLRRFPTIRFLANAKQRDVVMAWQGMGYNNRAVRLHKFAQTVTERHRGRIPGDLESLIVLPGIGKYTAHALLSSAFGMQLPVVDINVQRVLSRMFWRMGSTVEMQKSQEVWKLAETILPAGNAYDWNQALMDFGSRICTARNPKCEACPVARHCVSRIRMKTVNTPRQRQEKSLDGIPNRIYRGRIIERLRLVNERASIRADVLGRFIFTNFSRRNESSLKRLLGDLQRDGLVRVRGNGTLTGARVSLA
jgi:A/G-specific adenine glycosylase